MQVEIENDRLFAIYGDMVIPLSHKCYDIFNGKMLVELLGDKSMISFSFSDNTSGDICELFIPLDQSVKPINFKRKADSDLFSIDYLSYLCESFLFRSEKRFGLTRLVSYANAKGWVVAHTFTEIGSGLNGHRPKLIKLLTNSNIKIILVEHRDRLMRFGTEYVESALVAQGRRLIVADEPELKDDLV